jgi:hypothetical protein
MAADFCQNSINTPSCLRQSDRPVVQINYHCRLQTCVQDTAPAAAPDYDHTPARAHNHGPQLVHLLHSKLRWLAATQFVTDTLHSQHNHLWTTVIEQNGCNGDRPGKVAHGHCCLATTPLMLTCCIHKGITTKSSFFCSSSH